MVISRGHVLSADRWCHERLDGSQVEKMAEACATFRELAEKYPESKWAKYARGRLAQLASETRIETEPRNRGEGDDGMLSRKLGVFGVAGCRKVKVQAADQPYL